MPSPNSAAVLQTREYVEAIDGADGGILRAKTNMSENGVSMVPNCILLSR